MEENPFESLAKGIHKNLNFAFDKGKREHLVTTTPWVASMLISGSLPYVSSTQRKAKLGFEPLSDRFIEPLAVFPLASEVVINKFGVFIPQSIFGVGVGIAYEQEQTSDGTIRISVHPTLDATHPLGVPQFGSARGLITISDDFDDPLEDFADYMQ